MSRKIEVDKLISFSDDLVEFLKCERDINNLEHCLEQSKALQSHCDADYNDVQRSLQEYHKKIDVCKQKIEAAKSEVVADEEIDLLQKELEEELRRESFLKEELSSNNTVISNDINMLERQMISIEERRQILKKLEQDDLRAQMKLSMYASITNIIPNLDDQSSFSGHIVDRNKKVVEKFEFDPMNMSDFDSCNNIWKMINL